MTLFRWVRRFTPLLVEAARPCRHAVGARWFVDADPRLRVQAAFIDLIETI